jgi:hypothetical protein
MNEKHTLSDNQIRKYMKEFELSMDEIIQMHEDFLGSIRRRELKCHSENTREIGVVHNSFVAIAEDRALENRIKETDCKIGSDVEFHDFLKQNAKLSKEGNKM